MRIYAIGDIHGQLNMLKSAHAMIEADRLRCNDSDALIVHLGDLIDRGPDSRGVIEYLMAGLDAGENWIVIKGNHDRYLTRFYRNGTVTDPRTRAGLTWLDPRLGGEATLASYGVDASEDDDLADVRSDMLKAVPETHVAFIEALPCFYETDDLIMVHAGIVPGRPMDQQVENDLIWIREGFLDDNTDHGKLVVHGHTALDTPEHFGNRVDLDSGAGYFRPITAAVFEGRDCSVLSATTRTPLLPPVAKDVA
ncbi:MAG: metallophosphoesterase family protein [Pseudoruegeria sp.]